MATYTSKFKPVPVFMKDFLLQYTIVELTANTTLATLPVNNIYVCNSTSPITIILPSAFSKNGSVLFFKNINSGAVTLDAAGSATIDGQLTQSLSQNSSMELIAYNGNWLIK